MWLCFIIGACYKYRFCINHLNPWLGPGQPGALTGGQYANNKIGLTLNFV